MAIINSETIKDKINQREIIGDVIMTAEKIGNLDNPAVVRSVAIKGRRGSIPMMGSVSVIEDVGELETSGYESAEFSNFEFDMKKDRIKLAISDEAEIDDNVRNPFELQKQAAAQALASSFDKQIATAITTTPQTISDITIGTTNVFSAIASAIGKMTPYKITAMCMPTETFFQVIGAIELRGSLSVQNADGTISIPAFPNIPVVISDNIPLNANAEGRIIFVSNEVPAAIKVTGAIKTRVFEDNHAGATVFQSDVFHCIKANVKQNSNSQNMGVVSANVQW